MSKLKRGVVLGLMGSQRLARMLYLGGKAGIDLLDDKVRKDGAPMKCPDIYYLLKNFNGGKDPTAPDPADHWVKPGYDFVNRTCDCIGGMAWAGGWDRYQPVRFSHIYKGWINTDSMCMDAAGPAKCFKRIPQPEEGCYVVYRSDPEGKTHRIPIGHIGGVVKVPEKFDAKSKDSWKELQVVDVASRGKNPANTIHNGWPWYGKDAWFIVPVMAA